MRSKKSSPDLSPREFVLFQRFFVDTIGLLYDETRKPSVEAALGKRMEELGISDAGEYYRRLTADRNAHGEQSELKHLLIALTIGETFFFRSPDQFAALRDRVLPDILRRKTGPGRTLRIWSAGCSTGEEPYSLAITVLEALRGAGPIDVSIIASDINPRFLDWARRGVYSPRAVRYVERDAGAAILRRYFSQAEGKYIVGDAARGPVTFHLHNLAGDQFPAPIHNGAPVDVIFCRNVLIYFDRDSLAAVIRRFHSLLDQDGCLFLGFSESLMSTTDAFVSESSAGAFYYRKRGAASRAPEVARPAPQSAPRTSLPILLQSARDPYEEAVGYLSRDDYDSGMKILQSLAEGPGGDPRPLLTLGNAFLDKNEFSEAIRHYRQALERDPLCAEGHFLLGLALSKVSDVEGALEELKRAVFLDKDFALAYYYRGMFYEKIGNDDMACKSFENAIHALDTKGQKGVSLTSYTHGSEGAVSVDLLMRVCREKVSVWRPR